MDIHKPKPWHGWREFLKEYLIIVIGVLTALSAEQAVEWLHVRHLIHDSESAMQSELIDDDLPQAYIRVAVGPCLENSLRDLRAAVSAGADSRVLRPAIDAYQPPLRTWDSDAWRATLASSTASRLDPPTLLRWSSAYSMIPFLQDNGIRERNALSLLRRTRYASGLATPTRVDELSDIVDDLVDMEGRMRGLSAQALFNAEKSGLVLSPLARQRLMAEARSAFGSCVAEPKLGFLRNLGGQTMSPRQREELERTLDLPSS